MARRRAIEWALKADPSDLIKDLRKSGREFDNLQDNFREGLRAPAKIGKGGGAGGLVDTAALAAGTRGIGAMKAGFLGLAKAAGPWIAGAVGTAAFVGLGKGALRASFDMDRLRVQFETFYGDAATGAEKLKETLEAARVTPFTGEQFAQARALQKALNLGDSIDDLKLYGDAAAALGRPIDEIVTMMGRLKSGQFGEAFEGLRRLGIGRKELTQVGLKFSKSGQFVGEVDQAMTAVTRMLNERFGGLGEKIGQNTEIAFQNMGALVKEEFLAPLGAELGNSLLPATQSLMDVLMPLARDSMPLFKDMAQSIGEVMTVAAPVMALFLKGVMGVATALEIAMDGFRELGELIANSPLGKIAEAAGGAFGRREERREEEAAIADLQTRLDAKRQQPQQSPASQTINYTHYSPVGLGYQTGLAQVAG